MNWYENPEELKMRRKLLKLTQADLAKAAGVERTWLVMVERGKIQIASSKIKSGTKAKLTRVWQALAGIEIEQKPKPMVPLSSLVKLPSPAYIDLLKTVGILSPEGNFITEAEIQAKHEALTQAQMENLKEQNRILREIVASQERRRTKEGHAKDAKIAKLEQRVKDLMEMYEIGTEAVAKQARYEELRDKVSKDGDD